MQGTPVRSSSPQLHRTCDGLQSQQVPPCLKSHITEQTRQGVPNQRAVPTGSIPLTYCLIDSKKSCSKEKIPSRPTVMHSPAIGEPFLPRCKPRIECIPWSKRLLCCYTHRCLLSRARTLDNLAFL